MSSFHWLETWRWKNFVKLDSVLSSSLGEARVVRFSLFAKKFASIFNNTWVNVIRWSSKSLFFVALISPFLFRLLVSGGRMEVLQLFPSFSSHLILHFVFFWMLSLRWLRKDLPTRVMVSQQLSPSSWFRSQSKSIAKFSWWKCVNGMQPPFFSFFLFILFYFIFIVSIICLGAELNSLILL